MTTDSTIWRRPPYLKDLVSIGAWLVGIALILTAMSAVAHARPYRHHHAHVVRSVSSHSSGWSWFGGSSLVAEARSQIGNGAIYGRSTLWCARFMNYVLRATGHSGTGSDMAASFARYGRPSGPQVGAIAVMHRRGGGHVGLVTGFDSAGNPIVVSGNHEHRVAETVYPRSRVYAYRMPD